MIKGIDVSAGQGNIDWKQVKKAGYSGVIIRSSYGWTHVDACFKANVEGALKEGFEVGFYHFLYCVTPEETIQNAQLFYETVKPYLSKSTLGCWTDWEYDSDNYARRRGYNFNKSQRTDLVKLFAEQCKARGMKIGIYANYDYLENYFNPLTEYPLWLACWGPKERPTRYANVIWQWTDNVKVPGVYGNRGVCDGDYFYGSSETSKPVVNHKVITPGMRGEEVAEMQRLLISHGYSCGKTGADGIYGAKTKEALGAYQAEHPECEPVDYKCGPKTWASLLR